MISDEYLKVYKKYSEKYGDKTALLYTVGSFFDFNLIIKIYLYIFALTYDDSYTTASSVQKLRFNERW